MRWSFQQEPKEETLDIQDIQKELLLKEITNTNNYIIKPLLLIQQGLFY